MRGVTIQSRQLGRHLQELRKESGVPAATAASELGLSDVTIYRYEAGATVPKPPAVKVLCETYGADERMRDALVALAKEADTPGWWRSHNGAIPKWFEPFVSMEGAAQLIRAYDADVVPGLFQTRRYATEMVRLDASDIEHTVSVRMERQRLLTRRNPPQLDVILGEAALAKQLPEGVMVEQLQHLDERSRLPNVTLRILPLDRVTPALVAGQRFYILTFPTVGRAAEPPLVYAESLCGALYLDKPEEIAAYDRVRDAIRLATLPPSESRELIQKYIARCQ